MDMDLFYTRATPSTTSDAPELPSLLTISCDVSLAANPKLTKVVPVRAPGDCFKLCLLHDLSPKYLQTMVVFRSPALHDRSQEWL